MTLPNVGDLITAAEGAQLLESVQSINGASNTPATAIANTVQTGTFTSSFSAAARTTGTLTFPVAFNTAPVVNGTVLVGANDDVLLNWTTASSITAISWTLFQRTLTNITVTVTVHWIAVGT